MKRFLVIVGTTCGIAGLTLAYNPMTGVVDKPFLALLLPALILNLWGMFYPD
ncbi:hypothetical protein PFF91_28820 [Burkholderia cenocepacia]|uniref:hypothetical protein n=1 Tax=Burkholderia cenocepacia TaxID=95486 RepID=UPI0022EA6723|nr:hypothetical protein [Burkholderia cenocepacia]MDA3670005.1 hypothetical protein [Burkholderia cenocepacia]MDA3679741.1 hypothetical protein [Burkholderia cenocepacia]MDA3687578.1 hypothetical protein [Burkholderia cenocepacia]MDA3695019.1 hypothetical protein [Burkholderia cenocepacia]MDA3701926.1 hypothetical protein [Burkholderia cenocepacia]